jgi:hypothetical protein
MSRARGVEQVRLKVLLLEKKKTRWGREASVVILVLVLPTAVLPFGLEKASSCAQHVRLGGVIIFFLRPTPANFAQAVAPFPPTT